MNAFPLHAATNIATWFLLELWAQLGKGIRLGLCHGIPTGPSSFTFFELTFCPLFWENPASIGKCYRLKRERNARVTSQFGQFGSIRLRCVGSAVYSLKCRAIFVFGYARASNACAATRVSVSKDHRGGGLGGIRQQQSNDMVSNLLLKNHLCVNFWIFVLYKQNFVWFSWKISFKKY